MVALWKGQAHIAQGQSWRVRYTHHSNIESGRRVNDMPPRARRGNQSALHGVVAVVVLFAVAIATGYTQTPEPAASSVAHVLPVNTTIPLEFEEKVVSGVNARGSTFKMQVTEDIRVDDTVVIPKGTVVFGEVVDSKRAGMLGKAGVLVLSARYVHLDQRDIRLHSALGAAGDARIALALFVPFVFGAEATVERGTRVSVRTASDERF
jgi:hypothetical protein